MRDCGNDRLSKARRNGTRSLSLTRALRDNSGTKQKDHPKADYRGVTPSHDGRRPRVFRCTRVRGALAADDALKQQGIGARFRVPETPEWKLHAAELETEILKRGMMFEVIDWSEDQARLGFEE